MNTLVEPSARTIEARRVSDDAQRLETLPRHFGGHQLVVENAVYAFIRHLAPEYRVGYWHFYELTNGGFYMAPDLDQLRVQVDGNGYDGRMSADAAGLTACLFAFSHLSLQLQDDAIGRHYYLLRNYALEHTEAREILAAID